MGKLLKLLLEKLLSTSAKRGKRLPDNPADAKKKADAAGSKSANRKDTCLNCKKPNRRHDPCKTKGNDPTKEKNSMIDPSFKDQIDADLDSIIAGNVAKTGEVWTVNGRSFGMHDGALHPVSGPGIVNMSRMQHQYLKQLNNDPAGAAKFASNLVDKGILTPEEVERTRELWKKCGK